MSLLNALANAVVNPDQFVSKTDPAESEALFFPSVRHTVSGEPRRVGVEIEFAGLDAGKAAALLAGLWGGELNLKNEYEVDVNGSKLGDFQVEIDSSYLKRLAQTRAVGDDNLRLTDQVVEVAAELNENLIPCEIISPPLKLAQILEMDGLVEKLREVGARGTDSALISAYGVHFNPETPSLEADSILAYLQAFLVLYEWFAKTMQVDLTRRITPFIDPFPKDYLRHILPSAYKPTCTELIDDYLNYNPTRNRALDMLPLFAHLDEKRVKTAVPDPNIKARPTFHYRLANSKVADPHWSITHEWRYWLMVEALAQQPKTLKAMCEAYLAHLNRPLGGLFSDWVTKTEQWFSEDIDNDR